MHGGEHPVQCTHPELVIQLARRARERQIASFDHEPPVMLTPTKKKERNDTTHKLPVPQATCLFRVMHVLASQGAREIHN